MGILKEGIFGPITGKVKNMVFYTVNGVHMIRGVAEIKKKYSPSAAQKANNARFSLLSAFLRKVKPFLKIGFGAQSAGTNRSYHNLAASYNLSHAIRQVDGVPKILFDKVVLSEGNLMQAVNPSVQVTSEGLEINWDTTELPYAASQNRAMLLAYFPDQEEVVMNIDGAKRAEGREMLKLQDSYSSQRAEIYLAFRATDSNEVSTSQYLGRVN